MKKILASGLLFLVFFLATKMGSAQCPDPVVVDLSADPSATWSTASPVTPDGACCDMPGNFNCFNLEIRLHPDATSFSIQFTNATGQLQYMIDCGDISPVPAPPDPQVIHFCMDEPESSVNVTFCRPGNASYEFTVSSFGFDIDDVSIDPFDPVCDDDAAFLLTGGSPAGGAYFINNSSTPSTHFDAAIYGGGVHTIEYVYDNGCTSVVETTIEVYPIPDLTCEDVDVCQGAGLMILSDVFPELPQPGTFYYNGNPVTTFDPSVPGDYIFEYEYNPYNLPCVANCVFTITVNPLPVIEWDDPFALCDDMGVITLNSATPSGGEYAGDFVEGSKYFNTDLATPGNYSITYSYTDEKGCFASSVNTATLNPSPTAQTGDPQLTDVCATAELIGSATGGTGDYTYMWSPASMVDDYDNDTTNTVYMGATSQFTFTVTDQNGCSNSDEVAVVVEGATPAMLDPFADMCLNDAFIELSGGSPAGGSYFINTQKNPSDFFIPSEHGPGLHTITYVYTNLNGCTSSATQTLLVLPLPEIKWEGMQFCNYPGWQPLTDATPGGGVFSGNHVYNNEFNVELAGPGNYIVNYSYTDGNGCTASKNAGVIVHSLPIADAGTNQSLPYGETATLTAADAGTGNYNYQWEPSVFLNHTSGQEVETKPLVFAQTFELSVVDQITGCVSTDQTIVNVTGGSVVISDILYDATVCEGETSYIEVLASGGAPPYQYLWYEGVPPWVDNTVTHFNTDTGNPLLEVTPDTDTDYYLVITDSNGDDATGTVQVSVSPLPDVSLSAFDPVCANSPGYELGNAGQPVGGEYHFLNEFNQVILPPYDPYPQFNPKDIGEGSYTLVYEYTDGNGCTAQATTPFEVMPYVNADFFTHFPERCQKNQVQIQNNSEGALGYTWDFDDDSFTPADTDIQEFTYVYPLEPVTKNYTITLTADHPQCPDITSRTVQVTPQAVAGLDYSVVSDLCAPLDVQLLNESEGEVLHYFLHFGDGSVMLEEDFTLPIEHTYFNYSPGDSVYHARLVIASHQYYCTDADTVEILVYPQVEAGFALDPLEQCNPYDALISNNALHAEFWNWDFGDGNTFSHTAGDNILSLNHLYENNSSSPDTFELRQHVWIERNGMEYCQDTLVDDVVVFPEVEAKISTNVHPLPGDSIIEGCAPFTIGFGSALTKNADFVNWDFGDGGTSSAASLNHTFENNTGDTLLYAVTLTAGSTYGCSHQDIQWVRVLPEVKAVFTFTPQVVCSPQVVDFVNNSQSSASMDFQWDFGNGVFSSVSDTSVTYTEPGDIPVDFQVQLTVNSNMGCSDVFTRTITVYPEITSEITSLPAPVSGDQFIEGCAPFQVDLSSAGSVNVDDYLWSLGEQDASSTIANVDYTYSDPGSYELILETSSEYGCLAYDTLEVRVNPTPISEFSLESSNGCTPYNGQLFYNFTPESGVAYFWDLEGDGTTVEYNNLTLPSEVLLENNSDTVQTYLLELSAESLKNCSSVYQQEVTVYPEVQANIAVTPDPGNTTPDQLEACAPFLVGFNAGNSINATDFLWDFDDGTSSTQIQPEHTFLNFDFENQETYQVDLFAYSEYGCVDIETFNVIVNPQPLAVYDVDPVAGCSPLTAGFQNHSTGATSYSWDFDNGDLSSEVSPQTTYSVPATEGITEFHPTLTIENDHGCQDTFSHVVEVYPEISASFTADITQGCGPLTVEFTNTSQGDDTYLDFVWDYGDGNTSETASLLHSHTFQNLSFTNDTTFTVVLSAHYADVCMDVFEMDITVLARPDANFVIPGLPACAPVEVHIEDQSTGGMDYVWSFGDGSSDSYETGPVVDHLYTLDPGADPALYNVQLQVTASNGCSDTFSEEITIFPPIEAFFSTDISEGCSPLDVTFSNTSTGAVDYTWNYGDGNVTENSDPVHNHTFYNDLPDSHALFDVQLNVVSQYGCRDSVVHQIDVYPQPQALFNYDIPGGCSPVDVQFENISLGSNAFTWNFDDGTQSEEINPMHTFQIENNQTESLFDVVLVAENDQGCSDMYVQQINVYPGLTAMFDVDVTEGCSPLTVNLTNNTLGDKDFLYYEWDYGDGNDSENDDAHHAYTFYNYSHTNDSVFTVKLTASYADVCHDDFEVDILVKATPLADFVLPNSPACAPEDIIIENNGKGVVDCIWTLGDGSDPVEFNGDSFTHFYTQPVGAGAGTYPVTMSVTAANGCVHQTQQNVIIYPEIEADFSMNETEGCNPLSVNFQNNSEGAVFYDWRFADDNTDHAENPQHTFYNYSYTDVIYQKVKLSVTSDFGCEAVKTDSVKIFPGPNAYFETQQTEGCAPLTTQILNKSEEAIAYHWSFGDGQESEEVHENLTYTWENNTDQVVNYQVLLTAFNDFGCASQTFENMIVYPDIDAAFVTENNVHDGCSPLGVRFLNESVLEHTSFWQFGDGQTSTSSNPFNQFRNTTNEIIDFKVLLEVTSMFGCKDTVSDFIRVFPSPEADFVAQPYKQPYPNSTVLIQNKTGNGEWTYHWDFGDGNQSEEPASLFTHTYIWDGSDMDTKEYTVKLDASNEYCTNSTERKVIITSPVPEAEYKGVLKGCAPLMVNLENTSRYSDHYKWDFGDGSISTEFEPGHIYHEPGEYDLTLVATGDGGSDTLTYKVEVIKVPEVLFELEQNLLFLPGEPLRVVNLSQDADQYLWEFGDGNTSESFEPSHAFQNAGVYDITLTAYTDTDPQCSDQMTLQSGLRVEESCAIVFPNAFKPLTSGSGDGSYDLNDVDNTVFHPVHAGMDEYELDIFNKWGELIFHSEDISKGWDGYVNNKLAPMDVYVWRVKSRCVNGQLIEKSGDVTLIR